MKKKTKVDSIKRAKNKRFGQETRGRRRSTESINLRKLSYHKNTVLPKVNEPLGIYTEYVIERKTNKPLAGWVAISVAKGKVREFRFNDCIYQAKIFYDEKMVDRQERKTGITRKMLKYGISRWKVRDDIKFFLQNYTLIGANINLQLNSLDLDSYSNKCVDIYKPPVSYTGREERPVELKVLVYALLNKEIQTFKQSAKFLGSPITNSRQVIKLYRMRKDGMIEPKPDEVEKKENFEFCNELVLSNPKLKMIMESEKRRKENEIKRITRQRRICNI